MSATEKASQRRWLEEAVERFERAWQDGAQPSIEEYLSGSPAPRSLLLPELVHADLEYRLKSGDSAGVEDYLERFPELKEDRDVVVDLILADYRHRRYLGREADWHEYLPRFSEYESELRKQASLHSRETEFGAAPLPPVPAHLPARVGRYRLEREIDRGGMGSIVRIQDEDFQRPLAMKVLRDKYRANEEMKERLIKEAQLTGQLQHPGIPAVQEIGRLEDERPYFIMKLVKGQTLAALLKDRGSGVGSRGSGVGGRESGVGSRGSGMEDCHGDIIKQQTCTEENCKMAIQNYRDLEVWKCAIDLAEQCYTTTRPFPKEEMFGLTSQIRRAAVSIAANIAEGHGRDSTKEFLHHLSIAKGSLKEVETHFIISQRVHLLSNAQTEALLSTCARIGQMLARLIQSLRKRL